MDTNSKAGPKSFWTYDFGLILEEQGIRLFPGGNSDETSEANDLGGLRITTFMIYLNNVQAGGNTIFPQVKSFDRHLPGQNGILMKFVAKMFHLHMPKEFDWKFLHVQCAHHVIFYFSMR